MAFKIDKNPTFVTAVEVNVPTEEGTVTQSFKGKFRLLSDDEAQGFDTSTADGDKEFWRHVIVWLDGIEGPDGTPRAYDEELREYMLSYRYIRVGMGLAYARAALGARAKN